MKVTDSKSLSLIDRCRSLRPDFKWGTATSAAQVDGAAAVDGKSPSIWDSFSKQSGRVNDGSNINVACDHYNRFKSDVALMRGLGLDAYRNYIADTKSARSRASGSELVGFCCKTHLAASPGVLHKNQ